MGSTEMSPKFRQISRIFGLAFMLGMLFTQCQRCQKKSQDMAKPTSVHQDLSPLQEMVDETSQKGLPLLANILEQFQVNEDKAAISEANVPPVDINQTDSTSHNETALHQAIYHASDQNSIKTLIVNEANVNVKAENNVTLLHIAVQKEKREIVELLLDKGAHLEEATTNLQRRPIHIAAETGNPAIMQLLIDKGADIMALAYRDATPLHIAATSGNIEVVKILHQAGADINRQDQDELTALHLATLKGNLAIIEYLLKNGANPHTRGSKFVAPLHLAVYEGDYEVVKKLLELDKEPEAYIELEAENKARPLQIAAYKGHMNILNLLLDQGANMNAQDQDGYTALHWAVLQADTEVVKVLLDRGADKNIKNRNKNTPLKMAKKILKPSTPKDKSKIAEYQEIVKLLKAQK
jgi:ankyrin repeat protein